MRPNPDGFAPEVRAEMEKLFWRGIRALLSLTTGGPEEAYAEGGQNGELSALWGFGSSFPLIVAHASSHAALNRGREIFVLSAHAKLLVPVRMRCRVSASFCGGDAGLFARAATVWQSAMVPA